METLKPAEVLHEACQHQCDCGESFNRADTLRRHEISCRGKVLKKVDLMWRRRKECDKCLTLYAAVTKLFKDGRHRRHYGSELDSKTCDEMMTKLDDRKLVSIRPSQSMSNIGNKTRKKRSALNYSKLKKKSEETKKNNSPTGE